MHFDWCATSLYSNMKWQCFVLFSLLVLVSVGYAEEQQEKEELPPPPPPAVLTLNEETSSNLLDAKAEQEVDVQITAAEDDPDGIRGISLLSNGTLIRCPLRETYVECPVAHTCQRTCATLNNACLIQPTCTDACFCKDGYARDANNRCVPIRDCPGEYVVIEMLRRDKSMDGPLIPRYM